MLNVEEADQSREKKLPAEQTQKQAANFQCLLLSVVIVWIADTVAHIPDTVDYADERPIDQEVEHCKNGRTRVKWQVRDL